MAAGTSLHRRTFGRNSGVRELAEARQGHISPHLETGQQQPKTEIREGRTHALLDIHSFYLLIEGLLLMNMTKNPYIKTRIEELILDFFPVNKNFKNQNPKQTVPWLTRSSMLRILNCDAK